MVILLKSWGYWLDGFLWSNGILQYIHGFVNGLHRLHHQEGSLKDLSAWADRKFSTEGQRIQGLERELSNAEAWVKLVLRCQRGWSYLFMVDGLTEATILKVGRSQLIFNRVVWKVCLLYFSAETACPLGPMPTSFSPPRHVWMRWCRSSIPRFGEMEHWGFWSCRMPCNWQFPIRSNPEIGENWWVSGKKHQKPRDIGWELVSFCVSIPLQQKTRIPKSFRWFFILELSSCQLPGSQEQTGVGVCELGSCVFMVVQKWRFFAYLPWIERTDLSWSYHDHTSYYISISLYPYDYTSCLSISICIFECTVDTPTGISYKNVRCKGRYWYDLIYVLEAILQVLRCWVEKTLGLRGSLDATGDLFQMRSHVGLSAPMNHIGLGHSRRGTNYTVLKVEGRIFPHVIGLFAFYPLVLSRWYMVVPTEAKGW